MANYWQEAQQKQREASGTNAVFTSDEKCAITGYDGYGWFILTPEGSVEVQTAQGVDLMLKELALPLLDWH